MIHKNISNLRNLFVENKFISFNLYMFKNIHQPAQVSEIFIIIQMTADNISAVSRYKKIMQMMPFGIKIIRHACAKIVSLVTVHRVHVLLFIHCQYVVQNRFKTAGVRFQPTVLLLDVSIDVTIENCAKKVLSCYR